MRQLGWRFVFVQISLLVRCCYCCLIMRQSDLARKLDIEIGWLASHTDQAHPVAGTRVVQRQINGQTRFFNGEVVSVSSDHNTPCHQFSRI